MTQPTRIQGSAVDSFVRYNDQDGNRLVSLNKDGSVSTTGIQFSDGTTQDTAGGGGSSGILTAVLDVSPADMYTFDTFDLVAGVSNKIIIPVSVCAQCLGTQGNAYSTSGLAIDVEFFGGSTSLGGLSNQAFSQPGIDAATFIVCSSQVGPVDEGNAIGNPLQLVNQGNNFAGGTAVAPFTVGDGGSGYAPGDTGTWGQQQHYTYTVLTVDGGGAVLTFSVNTTTPDIVFVGNNVTNVTTGGGDFAFTIHLATVANQGTAPIRLTTNYYLVDATF